MVDLTECEFIDSSGVRAVLLSREAQNSDDGTEHLAVAAASEQILRILSVMGIDPGDPNQADGRGSRVGDLAADLANARHRRVPGGARPLRRARRG